MKIIFSCLMFRQSWISCQFHVRKTPLCVVEYQLPRVNNSDVKQKGMKYFAAESDNYSNHSRSNSGLLIMYIRCFRLKKELPQELIHHKNILSLKVGMFQARNDMPPTIHSNRMIFHDIFLDIYLVIEVEACVSYSQKFLISFYLCQNQLQSNF